MTDKRLDDYFQKKEKEEHDHLRHYEEDKAAEAVKKEEQINYFNKTVAKAMKRFLKEVENHVDVEDNASDISKLSYTIKASDFTYEIYMKNEKLFYDVPSQKENYFINCNTPYKSVTEDDIYDSVVVEFIKFGESKN